MLVDSDVFELPIYSNRDHVIFGFSNLNHPLRITHCFLNDSTFSISLTTLDSDINLGQCCE